MIPLKISIVVPSFNQGKFLDATLQSVLNQNYPNLELIVIDGGSSDGSKGIIERYGSQIAYWVSEPDNGHGDALQKGFARSNGEILAWINSDDLHMPWTLSTVAEVFSKFPDVEWLTGVNGWWNAAGSLVKVAPVKKNIYDFAIGNYQWIQQESTFWRRSLWDRAGGFISDKMRFMVDGELWCRFFLHSELFHLDTLLAGYRAHGDNRALLNYEECLSEMDALTREMRCSMSVKQQRFLRWAQTGAIGSPTGFRNNRITRLLSRRLSHSVAKSFGISMNYKVIEWDFTQSCWTVRSRTK